MSVLFYNVCCCFKFKPAVFIQFDFVPFILCPFPFLFFSMCGLYFLFHTFTNSALLKKIEKKEDCVLSSRPKAKLIHEIFVK